MGSTALISLLYPKSEKSDKLNLKIINLGDKGSPPNIAEVITAVDKLCNL